jgi:adenylosuccinate lyase
MIPRYADPDIIPHFTYEAKLGGWQKVELAVTLAKANLHLIERSIHDRIRARLEAQPFDIDWWLARDKEISHDLNAFLEERLRHLEAELTAYFHENMTSYDTEDPAFALTLIEVTDLLLAKIDALLKALAALAQAHQHIVMVRRTHGQAAKLGSFGGRVRTWPSIVTEKEPRRARGRN